MERSAHVSGRLAQAATTRLDQETYDRLPITLSVREMKFAVRERDFYTKSVVVVTTLCDADDVSREDLADLFRQRWHAELDLRNLKSTMSLDVLRCKIPEMVRPELWMGLLADNLVRHSQFQTATAAECLYASQEITARAHQPKLPKSQRLRTFVERDYFL